MLMIEDSGITVSHSGSSGEKCDKITHKYRSHSSRTLPRIENGARWGRSPPTYKGSHAIVKFKGFCTCTMNGLGPVRDSGREQYPTATVPVLAYYCFSIDPTIHHGQITLAAAHWHPTFKPPPYLSTMHRYILGISHEMSCCKMLSLKWKALKTRGTDTTS